MTAISLRLPDDVFKRLQNLADRTGRSKTAYMREAIKEHLDDLEDLHLAERRLCSVRAGRLGTVALDEVMKRYGLES
jgi:RHH-type transcriptional regulator, rel operon repressor / antitoxin RelB